MEFIEPILGLSKTIYALAENAKVNKERCQRIVQRVKDLEELVLTIKQMGPGQTSDHVNRSMWQLSITMNAAKELIYKYTREAKGNVKSFLKSSSHGDKFCKMNEKLSDAFQVLSAALQVEQRNMVLKVYETVTGARLCEAPSPGHPMAPPSTVAPMAYSSPTSPMPPLSTVAPIAPLSPVTPIAYSSPTAPTPPLSTVAPMAYSSPTAPTPPPSTVAPMAYSSPTSPMPPPSTVAPMAYSLVAPMPVSSPTAPMPLPSNVAPMAPHSTMPVAPNPLTISMAPMPPHSAVAPRPLITVAPMALPRPMAPMAHPSMMTPMPVSHPGAPVLLQMQNGSYTIIYKTTRMYFP